MRECLEAEEARNLVPRTLAEITLYPGQFTRFRRTRKIIKPQAITPVLCRDFVHSFDHCRSPARTKTVVWIVRKFGAWLALRHFTADNPAAALHHPRLRPRKKLPEYLTPTELRILLKTVIEKHSLQDLCIISLLAGTGLRSREIAQPRVKDINCAEHYLEKRAHLFLLKL